MLKMLIRVRELSANMKTQFWDKSNLMLVKSLQSLLEIHFTRNTHILKMQAIV